MPVVGYSGHLRNTHESHASFGTTHWKGAGFAVGLPPRSLTTQVDPESEQAQREIDEANEILELRSMGVRAALKSTIPSRLGPGPGDPAYQNKLPGLNQRLM